MKSKPSLLLFNMIIAIKKEISRLLRRIAVPPHITISEICNTAKGNVGEEVVKNEQVDIPKDIYFPIRFLFTTSSGVFFYDCGKVIRLVSGFCFGLVKRGKRLYFTRDIYRNSRRHNYYFAQILTCVFEKDCVNNVEIVRSGLFSGAHQLGLYNEHLLYPDGRKNRIFKIPVGERNRFGYRGLETIRVDAEVQERSQHINSILAEKGRILVLAHNLYFKTGKNSALYTVDHEGGLLDYKKLNARCAHDLAIEGGSLYVCNSDDGSVLCNGCEVFRAPNSLFTRGLLLHQDYNIIGGSERVSRKNRESTKTFLFFTDKKFNLLDTLVIDKLPSGEAGGMVKSILPLE